MVTDSDPTWAVTLPKGYSHRSLPQQKIIFSIQHAQNPLSAIRGDLRTRLHFQDNEGALEDLYGDVVEQWRKGSSIIYQIPQKFVDPITGEMYDPHTIPFIVSEELVVRDILCDTHPNLGYSEGLTCAQQGLVAGGEITPSELEIFSSPEHGQLLGILKTCPASSLERHYEGIYFSKSELDLAKFLEEQRANEAWLNQLQERLRNGA